MNLFWVSVGFRAGTGGCFPMIISRDGITSIKTCALLPVISSIFFFQISSSFGDSDNKYSIIELKACVMA